MSEAASSAPQLVTELKVSAHLMQLDAGVYCVYNTPGSAPPDPETGLPGVRLSIPPGQALDAVSITGFTDDGWLGTPDAAALVRVARGPAQLMMTIYQDRNGGREPPRLQVTKLVETSAMPLEQAIGHSAAGPNVAEPGSVPVGAADIGAHVQVKGDILGRLGEWIGERGSERWVEGFVISPRHDRVSAEEIEYQAVLGRGWLSPWSEGGQYCGSRGMALPILGLRARLRGKAAETMTLEISATFTDGSAIGPVGPGEPCEAESLAPLEAFCITIVPAASNRAQTSLAATIAMPATVPAPVAKRPSVSRPKPVAVETPDVPPVKTGRGRRG